MYICQADWLRWDKGRRFEIPVVPGFNTQDMANAGYLLGKTPSDNFYYLLFAGTTDRTQFEKRYVDGYVWVSIYILCVRIYICVWVYTYMGSF